MVVTTQASGHTYIRLHPNRSASWDQTKRLMILVGVFVTTVALGWFIVGAWLILPFAGFEVSLLAFLMYKVSHFTYQSQQIVIDDNAVKVQLNKRTPPLSIARSHCHILYDDTNDHWHLPSIKVTDDDLQIEVGDFLNLEDRKKLKHELQSAGLMVCRKKWWKQSA